MVVDVVDVDMDIVVAGVVEVTVVMVILESVDSLLVMNMVTVKFWLEMPSKVLQLPVGV